MDEMEPELGPASANLRWGLCHSPDGFERSNNGAERGNQELKKFVTGFKAINTGSLAGKMIEELTFLSQDPTKLIPEEPEKIHPSSGRSYPWREVSELDKLKAMTLGLVVRGVYTYMASATNVLRPATKEARQEVLDFYRELDTTYFIPCHFKISTIIRSWGRTQSVGDPKKFSRTRA